MRREPCSYVNAEFITDNKPNKWVNFIIMNSQDMEITMSFFCFVCKKIKDSSVVGKYDAVVVHADNSAVGFFAKNGFTDDVVLNSRWQ